MFSNTLFAHRGKYSLNYPENSIPAFKESVSHNLGIELDLHILKDNNVVVFHDSNLKRLCNKDVNIKSLTLNEIKKYKLLNTKYSIPSFKEVLNIVKGKVSLDIELKSDVLNGSLERETLNILKGYKGSFLLKSFNPIIVWRLKRLKKKYNMNYSVGLLTKSTFILMLSLIFINPDFISFHHKLLKKKFFKYASTIKPTLLYTIKTNKSYLNTRGLSYGLIIEDYESLTSKTLD